MIGPVIGRAVSLALDIIVLAFTWAKTADTWRISRQIHNLRPTLTTLILRDGMSLLWSHSSSLVAHSDGMLVGTLYFA